MKATDILGLAGAGTVLLVMFEMLRRHRLREKYAVLWCVVAVAVVAVALVPGLLQGMADVVGVEVPANLLFFLASMVLLLLSVQLSYELGRLEEKTRTLAEEVALLRLEVEQQRTGDTP